MSTFAFIGGATGTPGYGQNYQVEFSGVSSGTSGAQWANGDTWSISLVTPAGNITVGQGAVAGIVPICGFSTYQRMFLGVGGNFIFSAVDDPTGWDEQDVGAGSVAFESQFGVVDTVNAFALYQGRLAVFGLYSIQIWTTDADPANFVRNQVLTNIGTDAPLSVQGFGELDVFFRATSGVRSLRVRDSSLNGYITDVGSAIDDFLSTNTAAQRQASCSILEPTDHRYWLYENGVIYVLSYFPTLKISAWSTYLPQYDATRTVTPTNANYNVVTGLDGYTGMVIGAVYVWTKGANDVSFTCGSTTLTATGTFLATATTASIQGTANTAVTATLVEHIQTTFTPEKFVVYNGQVYVRATNGNIFQFGGSDNQTYDYGVCAAETPWLDVKNKVSTRKGSTGLDIVADGFWNLYASMDYRSSLAPTTMKQIKNADGVSTPGQGVVSYTAEGTHIKMRASTSPLKKEAATLSALVWHYKDEGEKR